MDEKPKLKKLSAGIIRRAGAVRRIPSAIRQYVPSTSTLNVRGRIPRLSINSEPLWHYRVELVLLFILVGIAAVIGVVFSPQYLAYRPGGSNVDVNGLPVCAASDLVSSQTALEPRLEKYWHLDGAEILAKGPLDLLVSVKQQPANCSLLGWQITYNVPNTKITGSILISPNKELAKQIPISDLGVNTYKLNVALVKDDASLAKSELTFYVSKPVYVAWTLDWEGYSFSNEYLNQIQALTERAQKVPLTHFFNPYYFINEGALKTSGNRFADWIRGRQGTFGDYVGLHIHMFYDLATAAGVEVRREPTWASRGTGSDVPLSSYTYEEQKKILEFGIRTLADVGFTNLIAFRAGGWFVNLDTFKALDELGFKIEASGRTAYSLGNNLSGPWSLAETAQPYYVCKTSQNRACRDNQAFNIMELPNNGLESYRYAAGQLIARFNANFNGQPQAKHRAITYLSHPEWFYIDQPKVNELFNHIDRYLFARDRGPVIYTTLENIYHAWQVNNY